MRKQTSHSGLHKLLQSATCRSRKLFSSSSSLPEALRVSPALVDLFGRQHNYLRVSLTERCNLRCQYCMPAEGVSLSPDASLLTLDERKRLIELFVSLGVNKVRFTGGEPTISKDLVPLIRHCRSLGVTAISMTSNGVKLKELLPSLLDAGLQSVNISLDTLQPKRFAEISRRPPQTISRVLASIFAAQQANIKVKINSVVMRGVNEDELGDFVRFGYDQNVTVRFIELMPFDGNRWDTKQFVGYFEMLDLIDKQLHKNNRNDSHSDGYDNISSSSSSNGNNNLKNQSVNSSGSNNVNKEKWQLKRDSMDKDPHDTTKWYALQPPPALITHVNAHNNSSDNCNNTKNDYSNNNSIIGGNSNSDSNTAAKVGFITSMSSHFCGGCNRVRLTADGSLKTCLFSSDDAALSLRDLLRSPSVAPISASEISAHIQQAVRRKKERLGGHSSPTDIAKSSAENRPMILIGG